MKQNPKQFNKLKKEWYDKLKEEGFEDIEQDEYFLKDSSLGPVYYARNRGKSLEEVALIRGSKEEYFRLVGHFLHDHKFKNETEKFIWQDHAEGATHRETSDKLKDRGFKGLGRTKVLNIITELRKEMSALYNKKLDNDEE